jgi:hypothetical protein
MKKDIKIFIFWMLFVSCTTIKPNYNNTEYKKELNLIFDNHNPITGPFINIEINSKSYMALFDTGNGNGILQLKQHFIDELNLKKIEETKIGTLEKIYNVPVYELQEFIIDNTIIMQNGNVEPLPEELNEFLEIVMGLSVFDDYSILLSYKQRKIYLYDKERDIDFIKKWTNTDLLSDWDKGIYFKGLIENKEYIFCLDTGSNFREGNDYYNIILNKEISEYITDKNDIIFEISGRKFKQNRFKTFDGNIIEDVPMDLFLGYDFLRKYDVLIEKGNMRLYIEK